MPSHTPFLFNPRETATPHKITRPTQVNELAEKFALYGWDNKHPALVGYLDGGRHVQLLTGTHRRMAAIRAGIKIPVVLWSYDAVQKAWGDILKWRKIIESGNPEKTPYAEDTDE